MNRRTSKQGERFVKNHRRWKRWHKIVGVMACLVVFCTTYALILPAVTLEKTDQVLACPLVVHQHTADCYGADGGLICGKADFVIHTHDDNCYDAEGNLVCQLAETQGDAHQHTADCYDEDGNLICGQLEVQAHQHGDGCFEAAAEPDSAETSDAGTPADTSEAAPNSSEEAAHSTIQEKTYQDDSIEVVASYGADANIPDNAEFLVEKQETEETGSAPESYQYKIGFYVDGEEVEPEATVSLQVRFLSGEFADAEGIQVIHYLDENDKDNTETIQTQTDLDDDGNVQASFDMDSFSIVEFQAVPSSDDTGSTSAAPSTRQTSSSSNVDSYLQTSGKNDWQIVSEGYTGNSSSNKTTSDDGTVRVQKNVIPTDVENEFLVYLSIDTKQLFAEYFQVAEYEATTSNNYHDSDLGTVVTGMTGNQKVKVTGDSSAGYSNSALFTIQDHNGNVLAENVRLYWSQANNVTFYLKTSSGTYILMGLSVKNGESNTVRLSEEAETYIQEEVAKAAQLDKVLDTMGDYIEFLGVMGGDYTTPPTYDESTKTLTWIPAVKSNAEQDSVKEGNTTTVWNLNIAELVYKVRLTVEKDGFHSAASNMNSVVGDQESYAVNNTATLYYEDGKTVAFQKPYVRGLRYNLKLTKIDKDTEEPLAGAVFTISGDNGSVTGSATATTDKDGVAKFTDLIGLDGQFSGKFQLTETKAPDGYALPTDPTSVSISDYTQHPDSFVADGTNMLYSPASELKIANQLKPEAAVILKKVSGDNTNTTLSGAVFDLYADENRSTKLYSGWTSDSDGIFSPDDFTLDEGTYYLVETKAPDGYNQLTAPVVITVNKTGVSAKLANSTSQLTVQESTDSDSGVTTYTILVTNSSGVELPNTGGPGTFLYTFGGLALLAAGLMYGYSVRRKHERRA